MPNSIGSGLFEGLEVDLLAAAGTHGRFQVEPTCNQWTRPSLRRQAVCPVGLKTGNPSATINCATQGAIGSLTVTINSKDEVSFSITDSAGRSDMSGKLDNNKGTANELLTWFCQSYDGTSNLDRYGTLLETRSIEPLGYAVKQPSDAAGRTLRSLDQLDNGETMNDGDTPNTVRHEICAGNTFEIAAQSQSTGTLFALLKNHFQNLSTWQKAWEWLVRNAKRFESRMPQG